ncbi:hypothetical protein CY35_14G103500 [Sphagnum magellanicum]|nr:hypothetical protein CY35_14G103500 [Sphagnum magellanicum]
MQEDCFKMEKDPDFVECASSLPVQIDSFLSEQAAADAAPSAMVSVIGLDSDKVAALCNEGKLRIQNACERNGGISTA